jgi:hypothetical protein
MNNKGQFSIIAALLVAVVLVASVMTTYSAIRYNPVQGQPQILSAVDETNQALKQLLGFTVGYYGSVLKVTGNVTYAQQLAAKYLGSGLTNVGDIKPEWGLSLNITDLKLSANWFTNKSYSQGTMQVTYDLNGLGITGISYSASSRLDVQVSSSNSTTQAQFKILTDNDEPLINLGTNNIKFYRYVYGNLTWEFSVPTNIISHGDGTYIVDLPSGVSSNSYVVQVEDTRGISVLASSFSQFTSAIAWNTTAFKPDLDYVDNANLNISGTHSNFNAQQLGPDGVFDTLTEVANGTTLVSSYPTNWSAKDSTTLVSGGISNLTSNDGVYIKFGSYGNSNAGQTLYAHQETAPLGSSYYYLKLASSDQNGNTLSISARNAGRQLIGKFVIPLIGISSIPASSGTIYYRAYRDSAVAGYCDADIIVSQSNGNLRTTLASNTASTGPGSLTTSWSTLSGTYSTQTYNVVDQTDYLEIDYYMEVTTKNNNNNGMYLRVDDNSLAQASQTRITNINLPTVYTAKVEFTGSTISDSSWNNLTWIIDGSASSSGVNATFQLYNWVSGGYSTIGDGYMNTILATGDINNTQIVIANSSNFVNSSGYWKVMVTTALSTWYDLHLDLIQYKHQATNYALNLQEQWLNINATNLRQDLCIKTGTMGTESLKVQIFHAGTWKNLMTLSSNYFNNVSLAPYINSANLTIRFIGNNEATDPIQDSWKIDSVYIKDQPDINFLLNLQESTFTLEVLQNGTMRWLGQNMQLTTQTLPIPPIPIKAIHVNQTINGVNQEVPFQIEDWASNYQIPLGLTSNSTVFGNRQMIVFLLNSKVTDFTIWWNGSDAATQTPLAFTSRYFTNDNTAASTLTNGRVTLQFGSFNVKSTVVGTSTYSTANFMRINQEASTYGAGLAYVIHHGIVRDVVQQEAEWNSGADGSPNLYANIVLTLPANTTYYTYQLRIMFINSTQARSITDLSPIQLTTSLSSTLLQTENGTLAGSPILQNGTGTFLNSTSGSWTAHHFSQFISDTRQGAGIMFTDKDNQRLYAFDSIAGSAKGAVNASSGLIQLLPVSSPQVQFTYAYDITWQGAVATFDNTTPLCSLYDGTTPMGLWILVEYPPTITVTPKS